MVEHWQSNHPHRQAVVAGSQKAEECESASSGSLDAASAAPGTLAEEMQRVWWDTLAPIRCYDAGARRPAPAVDWGLGPSES